MERILRDIMTLEAERKQEAGRIGRIVVGKGPALGRVGCWICCQILY